MAAMTSASRAASGREATPSLCGSPTTSTGARAAGCLFSRRALALGIEYHIPPLAKGDRGFHDAHLSQNGDVWYVDARGLQVGKMDPRTATWTDYPVAGPQYRGHGLTQDASGMGLQLPNADDGSRRVGTPRASQVVFHVTTLRRPPSRVKDRAIRVPRRFLIPGSSV